MPSHYAHYYFGNEVIRVMPGDVKNIISSKSRCLDAYRTGLQGPDFLAFYRPWRNNPLKQEGRRIHNATGAEFFRRAIPILRENPQPEAYSYIFGCINHFILDAACHPVVSEYMNSTGLSHGKIEREFDSYILRLCGKSPKKLRLETLFPHDPELDPIISRFYSVTTPGRTGEAIDTMTRILNLFADPNKSHRRNLYRLFTLLPVRSLNKTRDMIYFEKPEPKAAECSKMLFNTLNKAVLNAASEMDAFMDSLLLDEPLGEVFRFNFLGKEMSEPSGEATAPVDPSVQTVHKSE